jgi:CMP-N-acetylneuraminic acid synthetase
MQMLQGETLVARAVRHARESGAVEQTLVTTDSEEIAAEAKQAGAIVPFLRPIELSGDLTTTEETLRHALLTFEKLSGQNFDICVFITATDIFRTPSWIAEAVALLKQRPDLDSVFMGLRTHKNFWERQEDGSWVRLRPWMSVYSSRQVRRFIVREDTGLASASRSWIWRQGRRIGDRVEVIVHDDDFTAIDIHSEEDLRLAEAALRIRGEQRGE